MVAAFPLAKIGLLVLKQLSKPLANIIKNEAKKHPTVRKYVILPTGRAYNWFETRTLFTVKGKPSEKLSEEEIVELGSNAIGEILLFSFLSTILLAEYNRHGDKKAVIQKIKEDEISNLVDTVLDVIKEVHILKETVARMKSDIDLALDISELEEQRHSRVYDHNFLDIMINRNKHKHKQESLSDTWESPST